MIDKEGYDITSSYQFNVGIAQKYGVNEAIFINNLVFWIKKNIANEKNYYDGFFWTYNSISAFEKLFSFWTNRQIRTIIDSLTNKQIIKKGNYNKSKYDRTSWYAIVDPWICQICLPDLSNMSNQFDTIDQPIPNINTDSNPDSKTYINDEKEIETIYNAYPSNDINNHNKTTSKSHKDKDKIKKIIKDKGFDFLKANLENYISECSRTKTWLKNFSTYLNQLPECLPSDNHSKINRPDNYLDVVGVVGDV